MSSSNCCFLTCTQVSQEAGQVVWYSHLFQNFPQFILMHTVKGFSIVNKAEIDVFWNSLAFSMIQRMLAIWSLVPLPFRKPAWTSGSSWFTYCWSLALENFEHSFTSVWDEWNCVVVWAFFGEGNGTPLQYSCLGNHMDRGAWWAILHRVAKSRTRLSDWTELNWMLNVDCVDHNKLWKILKEMGIPDHLKNLYAGQEATVRIGHGTTDWYQIGKGIW